MATLFSTKDRTLKFLDTIKEKIEKNSVVIDRISVVSDSRGIEDGMMVRHHLTGKHTVTIEFEDQEQVNAFLTEVRGAMIPGIPAYLQNVVRD